MYYFVVYENRKRRTGERFLKNTILKDVHPVIWAANPPEKYALAFTTYLRFWAEIPKHVALESDAKNWTAIEY